jgi:hypothetical protein
MGSDKGVKYDTEKPRMDLVLRGFSHAIEDVADVGTYGASKYTDDGWQSVDNGIERYLSAMIRHYLKYRQGEMYDTESELPHLSHMAWNALAVLELWRSNQTAYNNFHECSCGECTCKSSEESVNEHDYQNEIDKDIRSIMYSFYGYDDIE